MALAQYSKTFWFPTGTVAASIPARVFPENSSTLATLYTDATGTTTLPNPLNTTAAGVLTFWAEEGQYWIHADTESFAVAVGAAAQPATQQDVDDATEPIGLDTGVIFGGELNANLANPLALDIGATVGFIVDYVTTPATPVVTRVEIPAQTVALTDVIRVVTWWMADSTGAIIQQGARPTNAQRRTHLQLGATAQTGGAIFVDQTLPVILPQPTNQLYDLLYALGSFNIEGDILAPAGANLQVAKSAGTVFAAGFNHFSGPALTNDPHVSSMPAQNPTSLRYVTRTPAPAALTVTNVDVANYDNAGVITAIGGGANRSTIQHVYLFPVNTPADQIVVQYGQTIYSSLSEAVAAVGADPFVQNPTLTDGILLGFIVATRTATNLSDTAQARIIMAGKFGSGPAGSTFSGGGGSTIRTARVRITDDNLSGVPSAAAWTIVQTSSGTPLQCSIAAAIGDRIVIVGRFMRSGSRALDWLRVTSGIYLGTDTTSPLPEGDPALYPSLSFSYDTGPPMFTVVSGDISGGLVTVALANQGTSAAVVYAHTTYPFRLRLENIGPEPA